MKNQVKASISPNHLAILKIQLNKKSYKKAKKLSETHNCQEMTYPQFLTKIQ
jgi:hypothetical protein